MSSVIYSDPVIKQVIVIRKDLNMRKGKMCAQAAHASLGAVFKYLEKTYLDRYVLLPPEPMRKWIEGRFTKIVVGCNSEFDLFRLRKKAIENDVPFALIEDIGKTEFHEKPTLTAIAIGPDYDYVIDPITGDLELL